MSHRAESSSSSRSIRRHGKGISSTRLQFVPYPVGSETGLPLITCPDCKLVRVIELRVKKDTENQGRSFFKCPRNGCPKLCGFYKFQKEYLDVLVKNNIIKISCEQIDELEEGSEDGETGAVEDVAVKNLEKKMEKMMWKMNFFFACVVVVVVAALVKNVGLV